LVLAPVRREVFHPYSDKPEEGIWINCYGYEKAFGEKVRALGERTRPHDLYDVVNLYRDLDTRPTVSVLRDVLQQKCAYKGIPIPTYEGLLSHRALLEQTWANMLGHRLPVLPPLNDFWETAVAITDLAALPGNRFEALLRRQVRTPILTNTRPARLDLLKGDRKGQYSIRINDQWRICLEWPAGSPGPENVEIVDYH